MKAEVKSYVSKQTFLAMRSLSFFYIIVKNDQDRITDVQCWDCDGNQRKIQALENFENPTELIEFRLGLEKFKQLCKL
jgi:hypothetical protein